MALKQNIVFSLLGSAKPTVCLPKQESFALGREGRGGGGGKWNWEGISFPPGSGRKRENSLTPSLPQKIHLDFDKMRVSHQNTMLHKIKKKFKKNYNLFMHRLYRAPHARGVPGCRRMHREDSRKAPSLLDAAQPQQAPTALTPSTPVVPGGISHQTGLFPQNGVGVRNLNNNLKTHTGVENFPFQHHPPPQKALVDKRGEAAWGNDSGG